MKIKLLDDMFHEVTNRVEFKKGDIIECHSVVDMPNGETFYIYGEDWWAIPADAAEVIEEE